MEPCLETPKVGRCVCVFVFVFLQKKSSYCLRAGIRDGQLVELHYTEVEPRDSRS